jgi:hypothetical protein
MTSASVDPIENRRSAAANFISSCVMLRKRAAGCPT